MRAIFRDPQHPYTRGLLASMPGGAPGARLRAIEGTVPLLGALPPGCAFDPRCPDRFEPCDRRRRRRTTPSARTHGARCYLHDRSHAPRRRRAIAERDRAPDAARSKSRTSSSTSSRGGGLFAPGTRVTRRRRCELQRSSEGETFGLVGESGSGKTTTGRCILRLIEPTVGRGAVSRRERAGVLARAHARSARRDMQIVFQDPYSSLNPRMRVGDDRRGAARSSTGSAIAAERRERGRASCFDLVGLDPAHLERYPHEFSGGQRQRIGLARALALNPSFLIARRAGLGARRLGAGAGRQPADGSAAAAEAHLPVHRARPAAGRAHLQPRGGDVSGKDRGDGRRRRRCSRRRSIPTRGRCCRRSRCRIPDAPRQRIVLDPASFDRAAPLREIAAGHLAAV